MDGAASPFPQALQHFTELLATPGQPPLDELALAMSAVLQPAQDGERCLQLLDELAAGCTDHTREGVAEHLFRSGRLTGDRTTYSDWRNSCLDHVVATGRGLPITLAVVGIEVARRVGVDLVGVGMPAHFLVGDPSDPDWFLDPFHDGRTLDRGDCRQLFTDISRGGAGWKDENLDPTPHRAIVARMLNNLTRSFLQRNDRVRLALVSRMRLALAGARASDADLRRAQALFN